MKDLQEIYRFEINWRLKAEGDAELQIAVYAGCLFNLRNIHRDRSLILLESQNQNCIGLSANFLELMNRRTQFFILSLKKVVENPMKINTGKIISQSVSLRLSLEKKLELGHHETISIQLSLFCQGPRKFNHEIYATIFAS